MKDLEILGVLACSAPLAPVATRPLEHIEMVNILNLGVQYDKRNLIFLDSTGCLNTKCVFLFCIW